MAIHASLLHRTVYTYDRCVAHGPHVIRLRPAPHCRTRILSYSQKILGGQSFIHWQQDPFSNWNARVVFPEPMKELAVEISLIAEVAAFNPFDFFLEEEALKFPFEYDADLKEELAPFLEMEPAGPLLQELLSESEVRLARAAGDASRPSTIDFLVGFNQRLQKRVRYLIRLEPGVQGPEVTLKLGSGSCRDSAWLMVGALRHLGLAARFVSGYLIQLKPDEKPVVGVAGPGADFADLHAWCEVYLPGAGWVGLDPTSGLFAGEGHIPLSCTPSPSSAAPVSGAVDVCEATLHHEMKVERIDEIPRVTKPYSEEQWRAIDALGREIDLGMAKEDVRLTMGGEPTFVSMDDPDGPEWNTEAVSAPKKLLSETLLRRLQPRFARGSVLHYGQGKWYPGEPLPRWALSAYWRKDGVPMWRDASLLAEEAVDYGHDIKHARRLAVLIAQKLEVDPTRFLPAHEDVFYLMWKERRLPSNVTPGDSRLKDPMERARLARLFQAGLGSVVGYVLPLSKVASAGSSKWQTGPWFLRDGEIIWLIPGDSPMGLRLPLDSLPWVTAGDYPWQYPPDPTQQHRPLPHPGHVPLRYPRATAKPGPGHSNGSRPQAGSSEDADKAPSSFLPPPIGQSAASIIRTALCVEPRSGRLHVFLPPVGSVEDYLELLAAVESAASENRTPVIIEGEPPPRDPRVDKFSITPDPGVIEVNLHPSSSWEELVFKTSVLYEEAAGCRLRAEKFMMDGRHVGSGGGNHILVGGATMCDSPLLRCPDLLRSMVAYWQRHPSLSWVFSGLFLGPSSQAPRIDEARQESLHELEIAFAELEKRAGNRQPVPPWLVDRLFRNLLVDATGNTHRAEFCIDKLYPPDDASRRLGLLEMRGFEMPPHPQMSLVQHLLLRGLVLMFWKKPFLGNLQRWGSDIHDRWMLPHYCEADLSEVLAELRGAGLNFQYQWFAPQMEFRFPRIGGFSQRDVHVELRSALEPWHVLGEEGAGGGTVRYVDSSLERIQVKAVGLQGDRFRITCNGRRVPLQPTGTNGEAVAGVRFRAWQPAECLQPTIPVHTPLTFDLYDSWNRRSLGGCVYHVAHPGGRNFTRFPVNASEAESRRLARFTTCGATQDNFDPPEESVSPEFPFTIDLRIQAGSDRAAAQVASP
ncbi:MAG: transglutaminase family protein [Verrucomicrobia bacterium]|nr:transglutaminase family protein [Verrucomicrobiota bacterium]